MTPAEPRAFRRAGFISITFQRVEGSRDTAGVSNVHWVEGRCMLVLGNQGPGPHAKALPTGARAIHERTKGQCPA